MDKTARTELQRTFLIEDLPEPLTRASSHIQIFDNYISNTRMRIRSVRDPESRGWTHFLQQRVHSTDGAFRTKVSEIYLNGAEYERFKIFEGSEIRKNRYFHEVDGRLVAFDVYLGNLWGLNTASVEFKDEASLRAYEPAPFAVYDVTNNTFFFGENLVSRAFADVQAEVAKMREQARKFPSVNGE